MALWKERKQKIQTFGSALELYGFQISSRSEVEQLVHGLKARVESLEMLTLKDIVLDVIDKAGFLDPIVLALAPVPGEPCGRLKQFKFSCAGECCLP